MAGNDPHGPESRCTCPHRRRWLQESAGITDRSFRSPLADLWIGVLYTETVRRLFLLIVLGILAMDATGLDALVSQERCTSIQDSQPDGACPALCVRCTCCAQPIVPNVIETAVSMTVPHPVADLTLPRLPRTTPSKIFHVPKFASTTI